MKRNILNPARAQLLLLVSMLTILLWGCVGELPLIPSGIDIEWEEFSSPWLRGPCRGVACDSEGRIFLSSTDNLSEDFNVRVSTDGGENWTTVLTSADQFGYMIIDRADNIFCTGHRNIALLSRDHGETWEDIREGLPDNWDFYTPYLDSDGELVLSVGDWQLLRYDLDGKDWITLVDSLPVEYIVDVGFHPEGRIMVATGDTLIFSDDDFNTWRYIDSEPWEYGFVEDFAFLPDGTSFVTVRGRAYRSTDMGESWALLPDLNLTRVWTDRYGRLFGCDYNYLKASYDDGESWHAIKNDFSMPYQFEIAADDEGAIYVYAGSSCGLIKSMDQGENWRYLGLPSSTPNGILCSSGEDIYLTLKWGGIYRYPGQSHVWVCDACEEDIVYPDFLAESNFGELFTGSNRLYRKFAEEESWREVEEFSGWYPDRIVFGGDSMIAVTSDNGGVFVSPDYGNSWEILGMYDYYLSDIVIDQGGRIFVSANFGGVFRYDEDGDVWDQINSGLDDLRVTCLAFDDARDLYAGTEGSGIYLLRSGSTTWQKYSSDDFRVTVIEACGSDILVGTKNEGLVWTYSGSGICRHITASVMDKLSHYRWDKDVSDIESDSEGYIYFLIEGLFYRSTVPLQDVLREMSVDGS